MVNVFTFVIHTIFSTEREIIFHAKLILVFLCGLVVLSTLRHESAMFFLLILSLAFPLHVYRQSWKKWWSRNTPGLTARTRAVTAKVLRPRQALLQGHRSTTKGSSNSPNHPFVLQVQWCFQICPRKGDFETGLLDGSEADLEFSQTVSQTCLCFIFLFCLYQLNALFWHYCNSLSFTSLHHTNLCGYLMVYMVGQEKWLTSPT